MSYNWKQHCVDLNLCRGKKPQTNNHDLGCRIQYIFQLPSPNPKEILLGLTEG